MSHRNRGIGNARKRRSVITRDGWVCWICGNPINPDAEPGTRGYGSLDHCSAKVGNLRLAHRSCNSKRGNRESE